MRNVKMLEQLKDFIRPVYHNFRWMAQRLRGISPDLPVFAHSLALTRIGTGYGGWSFVDDAPLSNSTIVSCGLGEDASFDIEFASRYGARVLVVDPTPRAILHFKGIESRIGKKQARPYTSSGAQPVEAYDLSNISQGQLLLCEKALWNQNTRLQFFAPTDPSHVSHSILNFQNNYSTKTAHIEVEAITIDRLLADFNIESLQLLKLDIEGAEVEVLTDMISKGIYPSQVLVEYDELSAPSKKSRQRIESAHYALIKGGYRLVNREHTNFTYIHQCE